MKKISNCLKLMRPKQWVKNGFVLGALLFSYNMFNMPLVINALLACLAFCLASSTVYVLNDIVDIEKDKAHPKKCKRPLASGAIKIPEAIVLGILLMGTSLYTAYKLNYVVMIIIVLYFVNNIIYSFKIKNVVLLDVFSIAVGFVLRVLAGAAAIDVVASDWIILCTFFLSLFLGLGKRKGEIALLKDNADNHRKILVEYTKDMLNTTINIVLACTVVFYAIYTVIAAGNSNMIYTTIFVVYGVFRYSYLLDRGAGSSPTDIVTSDKHLILTVLLWVASCVLILM